MMIEWKEELYLSDKEVEIICFLANAEHNMYTWYANDHHNVKHPFELHEANSLVSNGFLKRGSDYNFGDEYVYFTQKGRKLAELVLAKL